MGDDYEMPSFRKSKNDKRKKRRYGVYKKGGKFRSDNVSEGNKNKNE